MQTFLPFSDFRASARVLDRRRLGKQRVECLQLLNVNLGLTARRGWFNHPAARMWRNHELWLVFYAIVICEEWLDRGYKDTLLPRFVRMSLRIPSATILSPPPPWLGREDLHASHRSNLLRKDPSWYGQFSWSEPNDLPYVWPV